MIIVVDQTYVPNVEAFKQYACAQFISQLDASHHSGGFLDLSGLKYHITGDNWYYKVHEHADTITATLYQPVKIWHPPTVRFDLSVISVIKGQMLQQATCPCDPSPYRTQWTQKVRSFINSMTTCPTSNIEIFRECVEYLVHTSGIVHANPGFSETCKMKFIEVQLQHNVDYIRPAFSALFGSKIEDDPTYIRRNQPKKPNTPSDTDKDSPTSSWDTEAIELTSPTEPAADDEPANEESVANDPAANEPTIGEPEPPCLLAPDNLGTPINQNKQTTELFWESSQNPSWELVDVAKTSPNLEVDVGLGFVNYQFGYL